MTPMNLSDVARLLPHRPPFAFVDRVVEFAPDQRLVAEHHLQGDAPHFAGHFPGRPLMPGVLVTEALAQASGLLIALTRMERTGAPAEPPPQFYLAAVQMKFLHPAAPGDTLTLRTQTDATFGQLHRFQVEARIGLKPIAIGTVTLAESTPPG